MDVVEDERKRETSDTRVLLLYRHRSKYLHPFALNTFFFFWVVWIRNVCCVHGGGKAVRKRRFVVRATDMNACDAL